MHWGASQKKSLSPEIIKMFDRINQNMLTKKCVLDKKMVRQPMLWSTRRYLFVICEDTQMLE
jgi:hypothetical protein